MFQKHNKGKTEAIVQVIKPFTKLKIIHQQKVSTTFTLKTDHTTLEIELTDRLSTSSTQP